MPKFGKFIPTGAVIEHLRIAVWNHACRDIVVTDHPDGCLFLVSHS